MSDFWRIVLSAVALFIVFFIGWFVAALRDGRRLRGMRYNRRLRVGRHKQ